VPAVRAATAPAAVRAPTMPARAATGRPSRGDEEGRGGHVSHARIAGHVRGSGRRRRWSGRPSRRGIARLHPRRIAPAPRLRSCGEGGSGESPSRARGRVGLAGDRDAVRALQPWGGRGQGEWMREIGK
jgi:hypothetical protein